ncbi:glycosyltransferase involved in cell wall biosynthesis [Methanococcus maripaludis]|uniref:Glycosyltransferase involved in cell wall biosynthesis n=1 Tax=Methanococcus maripaludis TaxID=39152 RepID=A0A7J9NZJ3_METMI|nr:glycosyltransferase family 1 protein [Methanococcus maripaludis]MBA2853108.1 glycosyltransferase involved in cell wall biosynthesis [Methanococcus maripaludis]
MKIGITSEQLNRTLTGRGNYIKNIIDYVSKNNTFDLKLINYKNTLLFPEVESEIIKNQMSKFSKKSYLYWYAGLSINMNLISKKFDLIHAINSEPIYLKPECKLIVTIYDLLPYVYPNSYGFLTSFRFKKILPKTVKVVDQIITISEHAKNEIVTNLGVSEEKIKVIPLAADENYIPLRESKINAVNSKYNINYPFIFYVGGLAPNKNVDTLIKSFYKLKKLGIPNKLLLAGEKRLKYKSTFELIEKLNLQNEVIFTGYVPDEDLPGLYNAADLFVYPSLYEGFGIPPLEAMACGTPVITSNTSSLPEVVGDAGITVNPYDVDELANKMHEVLTNEDLRNNMSKKGIERAKLFSWKKCAEEHLKVYEEVYNMK